MTPMHMTGLGQHPYGAAVSCCFFGNPRDIFEIFLLKQRENSLCFGVSPATSHHGSSPCILERLPGPSLCVLWELIQLGAADPEVPAPPCWEAGKRKRQGAEFSPGRP